MTSLSQLLYGDLHVRTLEKKVVMGVDSFSLVMEAAGSYEKYVPNYTASHLRIPCSLLMEKVGNQQLRDICLSLRIFGRGEERRFAINMRRK